MHINTNKQNIVTDKGLYTTMVVYLINLQCSKFIQKWHFIENMEGYGAPV